MEKTNNWKEIYISKKSVLVDGEKSKLIELPYKSELKGYKFWHLAKLVREGRNPDSVRLSYNDDFKFNVFKDEKNEAGEYVKVDEKTLSAEEFAALFKAEDNYFRYQKKKAEEEVA